MKQKPIKELGSINPEIINLARSDLDYKLLYFIRDLQDKINELIRDSAELREEVEDLKGNTQVEINIEEMLKEYSKPENRTRREKAFRDRVSKQG